MNEAELLADIVEQLCVPNTSQPAKAGKDAAAELRRLSAELEGHKAARMAYASEFPLNGEGEPDVGSIHQNIRALKAELAALKAAMGEPIGFMNAKHIHELQQKRIPYGYVYKKEGILEELPIYAIPKYKP